MHKLEQIHRRKKHVEGASYGSLEQKESLESNQTVIKQTCKSHGHALFNWLLNTYKG